MTGGSLPAMTWHAIMDYAHQGIELKQLPGIAVPPARQQVAAAENQSNGAETASLRPVALTKKGAEILVRVERLMDDANRALPALGGTESKRGATLERPGTVASTVEPVSSRRPGQN
jgi:penicillin-binding protein 1A